MNQTVKQHLKGLAEEKYHQFSNQLIPNAQNILGIRVPILRAYAKELVKQNDLSVFDGEDFYFEEKLLRGILIASFKWDMPARLAYIRDFVPQIDNWAVCDGFCSTLKCTKTHQAVMWDFIQSYSQSNEEYQKRFCAVMLLSYFVNEEYIDRTIAVLRSISATEYYSSMAVAWAMAECYIKFSDQTLPYLTTAHLEKETLKRTVRKICDSYRVDTAQKEQVKAILYNL